jgi:hypothetical protein
MKLNSFTILNVGGCQASKPTVDATGDSTYHAPLTDIAGRHVTKARRREIFAPKMPPRDGGGVERRVLIEKNAWERGKGLDGQG